MATIKYKYITLVQPVDDTVTFFPLRDMKCEKELEPLTDTSNPLFNFTQNFFDKLQKLSVLEMAQAVPYISLSALKRDGTELKNFNLSFFHKQANFSKIGESTARYPERPVMSLKSVDLKTDMASGYLYYTNVRVDMKIHRPDTLTSNLLVAFLFPRFSLSINLWMELFEQY